MRPFHADDFARPFHAKPHAVEPALQHAKRHLRSLPLQSRADAHLGLFAACERECAFARLAHASPGQRGGAVRREEAPPTGDVAVIVRVARRGRHDGRVRLEGHRVAESVESQRHDRTRRHGEFDRAPVAVFPHRRGKAQLKRNRPGAQSHQVVGEALRVERHKLDSPALAFGPLAQAGSARQQPQPRARRARPQLPAQFEVHAAPGFGHSAGKFRAKQLKVSGSGASRSKPDLDSSFARGVKLQRLAERRHAGRRGHAQIERRIGLQ